jgi:peptide/nickel transport system substrate-binding protein/microcin C transport system substrate-binding protein
VVGAAPLGAAPAVQDDPAPPAKEGRAPAAGPWSHAFTAYGQPKYPKGFHHFDYVNPDAPKGGTLQLSQPDRRTSFDKFNPFTLKGNSPAGLTTLMFETLAVRSGDEPGTMYGLLAEEFQIPADKSSVTIRLNPRARFTNGDPVTAADVKYSFDMMTSKFAAPALRTQLESIKSATVQDDRTVRFELKDRTDDAIFNVGSIAVFSRKWGRAPDGTERKFDEIINEYPITTGPYTIASTDSARRIDFVRDPNYWGRDLGVMRGQNNFDRIIYRYYQDNAVAMEAFKAGEFDYLMEYSARRWTRQHSGAKWNDGRIVKEVFPNGFGQGLQSYLLNLRRPLMQDRNVRQALNLAYDFAAINVYKQYKHTHSMFSNSDFAAVGLPSAGELALLEPFRNELPAEVFGPAWAPPETDTKPTGLRENLRKAAALLEKSGWKIGPDGALRNAKGEQMEVEWLESGDQPGRAEAVFERNLAKLGIKLKIRMVDFALYRKRVETFDYDMIMIKIPDFTLPGAGELKAQYGSAVADEQGSSNYRGIKSRAVDFMLEKIEKAKTMDELRDASRALDRIIMHGYYQIPDLYAGNSRVSRWDKLGIPKTVPKYYTIATPSDWLQWGVTAWWDKSLDKK